MIPRIINNRLSYKWPVSTYGPVLDLGQSLDLILSNQQLGPKYGPDELDRIL